jgi:hypothetical protein
MKGYNKRGCYRYGGTLKTKTVAGLKTGNHDNPNVLRAMRGHDGGSADGQAGRGSLARATRKRADGGTVADKELSPSEEATLRGAKQAAVGGGALGLAGAILSRRPGRIGTSIGVGLGGGGANMVRESLESVREGDRLKRENRKDGGSVNKGPLNAKRRNALGDKSFALPGRRYPINDPNHARAALSRVSQHGSQEEKAKVRSAVHKKFPSIGEKD